MTFLQTLQKKEVQIERVLIGSAGADLTQFFFTIRLDMSNEKGDPICF